MMNSGVMWPSCLLHMRRRGFPFAFSWVKGSKQWCSHSKPYILLVHPLIFASKCQSSEMLSEESHFGDTDLPLKMMREGIVVPSTQIASMTVTYSCRPGDA